MLLELRLKDFVLIPEARLHFKPGLVVFTGETGAGKSLLIQSLKLLLGARGGAHLVRSGAKEAILEAVLVSPALAERLVSLGLPPGEEIVLRRIITRERSRIYVNGSPFTAQMLASLLDGFILLASQHEYQLLSRPEERLRLLDTFASLKGLLASYREAFEDFRKKKKTYEDFLARLRRAAKERDFLLFQIREIEEVSPRPGEDEELEAEAKRLRHLSKLKDFLKEASSLADRSAQNLGQVRRLLTEAREFDPSLSALLERAEGLFYEVEDLSVELSRYLRELPQEDSRLAEVEERLYQLRRLTRKYGPDLQAVLEEYERLKKELEDVESGEERLTALEAALSEAREKVLALAKDLSQRREEAAKALSFKVREILASLSMAETRFQVEVSRLDEPKETGLDQVEFMVATTPQSPLRPLTQVASGGELSRLFLAIKTTVTQGKELSLAVFDEVDAGIGGVTAHRVGELLKELAQHQQVICVTHLPQIAALADQHFWVHKEKTGEEIVTQIQELDQAQRLEELARMLGGPEAKDLAERLLGR